MIPQFSAPFSPRPPDTTIAASSNDTLSVPFSTAVTCTSKSVSARVGTKGVTTASVGFSFTPKALGAMLNSFTGVESCWIAIALLENTWLFTLKVLPFSGSEITLAA